MEYEIPASIKKCAIRNVLTLKNSAKVVLSPCKTNLRHTNGVVIWGHAVEFNGHQKEKKGAFEPLYLYSHELPFAQFSPYRLYASGSQEQ